MEILEREEIERKNDQIGGKQVGVDPEKLKKAKQNAEIRGARLLLHVNILFVCLKSETVNHRDDREWAGCDRA